MVGGYHASMHTTLKPATPVDLLPEDIPRLPTVTVAELEVHAADLDSDRAAAIYRKHGALVIRGLYKSTVAGVRQDIERAAAQAISLIPQAKKCAEGWLTPDGTLLLPAPAHYHREQQLMVLQCDYKTSANIFRAAVDETMCDLAAALIGPDVELFMDGQVLYKEPVGGHPKHLHQDSAYFEHRLEGPLAALTYVVDTDLNNGALHVIPGSHRCGVIQHVDTFSHLGLPADIWPWERAVPICGQAGDAILFHVHTIHGSKENFSTAPRPVFINRYRDAADYVLVGATSTAARKEAESQEARKAVERSRNQQRGLMVRGYRGFTG